MANYMFILRSTEKVIKTVCPVCAERGEVLDNCPMCKGSAVKKNRFTQYYVQDKPIEIVKVDRDPKYGILRYWENASEFYYETTYPTLNKYVPEVPYGVHLCHDTKKSAQIECERINTCLANRAKADNFESIFDF